MPPEIPQQCIDKRGFEVSLLRVAPGMESHVDERLRTAVRKASGKDPVCSVKLLGRYDLCMVYETPDFQRGPSKEGLIEGIRGGVKIHALHWFPADRSRQLAINRARGSVFAFLFFRFNESILKRYGANIESQFAAFWPQTQTERVATDVFSTTGWAELLFVFRGHDFASVTAAITRTSNAFIRGDIPGKNVPRAVPAKTFSILGIDFSLTGKKKRHYLRRRFTESFRFHEGVYPILNVTCPAGSMNRVATAASRSFGKGVVTYGPADFVFCAEKGTWGNFIADVLDIRSALGAHVYSTSVSVLDAQSKPRTLRAESAGLPDRPGLRMSAPLNHKLADWGSTLEQRVVNVYFGVSNLLQDPIIGSCFEDLRPMLAEYLPVLLTKWPADNEYNRRFLRTLIEIIDYGTRERAHGAFLALEQMEGSLSPTKGGIQRVLAAASLIPRFLLSRVHKKWYGFIVSGYQNQAFSSWHELINLPIEYLFRPEQWCGLFHETGHVLLNDKRFFNIDSATVARILSRASGEQKGGQTFALWENFASEVWADMFDLYFCYGLDFDLYLTTIWQFLPPAPSAMPRRYLLRYFVTYEYWKHMLKQPNKAIPSSIRPDQEAERFLDHIRALGIDVSDDAGIGEESIEIFEYAKELTAIFHRRFARAAPMQDLSAGLASSSLKHQVRAVLKGQVCLDPIEDPAVFLIALKKNEARLDLASRSAAIMSLWHTALTATSEGR